MSYQVLARKYRPKTFSDVVGQEHVLTALSNGLRDNRLHHAYLFSGTRGVGKTSIARLFAKGLNCENGVTAEPCGHCENCKAIEEGRFIDLIEIDAASRTKVEDTRELLDNVQYKPAQGRFKVYLIDEVHMLSRHSFNALLKTLEEPPEYVKFLLATTDPQKLPITILSRCMQFHLKALQPLQIKDHLQHILQAENLPFEPLALEKIAQAAQGSIRDSLSLTDQAIAMGNGAITYDTVKTMLGLLDEAQPRAIVSALAQGNGEQLMRALDDASNKGADWRALLQAVCETLHQVAILQFLPLNAQNSEDTLSFLAQHIAPQDVQFFYQTISQGIVELEHASHQRMAVEMVLLRALAFHPKFSSQTFTQTAPLPEAPVTAVTATQSTPQTNERPLSRYLDAQAPVAQNTPPATVKTPAITQAKAENTEKQNTKPAPKNSRLSNVLSALAQLEGNNEKKKLEPITEESPLASTFSQRFQDSLPAEKPEVLIPTPSAKEKNPQLAEEYHWEWINPEMAEAPQTGIRPLEIKQALEKRITPALQQRVIQQAYAQDPWAKCLEDMQIKGFLKDMALSTAKMQEDKDSLLLAIRREKSHLLNKYAPELEKALQHFYQNEHFRLEIQENDDTSLTTPLELQKKLYLQFCQEAREALQQDPKIALLTREFNAHLIVESILPA